MSISIKNVGGRKYAYHAYRQAGKIVQEYLGPVAEPAVTAKLAEIKAAKALPPHVRRLFWDIDPTALQLRQHSRYIIERILDIGDLEAFRWAQRQYPTALIVGVCRTSRRLSERSRLFWRAWLGDEDAS